MMEGLQSDYPGATSVEHFRRVAPTQTGCAMFRTHRRHGRHIVEAAIQPDRTAAVERAFPARIYRARNLTDHQVVGQPTGRVRRQDG